MSLLETDGEAAAATGFWAARPALDPRYASLRPYLLGYQRRVATQLARLREWSASGCEEACGAILERAAVFLDYVHPRCCARRACEACALHCTDCFEGCAHVVAGMCVLVAGKEEGSFAAVKPSEYLRMLDYVCEEGTSLTPASREALRWLTRWEMQTVAWIWGRTDGPTDAGACLAAADSGI
jgi:hypothetical protein